MNSQLSSCMVHVWLSMGKFFKSMGQESVSVSLENRSSSIIVYDMKRWYPRTLSHRQKGEWGTWLTTTCELHSTGYFLLMCHSNPFLNTHLTSVVTSSSSNLSDTCPPFHFSISLPPLQAAESTDRCWQTSCQPLWWAWYKNGLRHTHITTISLKKEKRKNRDVPRLQNIKTEIKKHSVI